MLSHNILFATLFSGNGRIAIQKNQFMSPANSMSIGNLIIHPPLNSPIPTHEALVKKLQKMEFIGKSLDNNASSYLAGERFLQLITFLGCSPHVRLEPEDENDSAFTHVQIKGPFDRPHLLFGKNTRPPGCPECGHRFADWLTRFMLNDDQSGSCPVCGSGLTLQGLQWRHQAGVANLFLMITDIFPGEAVPLPELLQTFNEAGKDWCYFYAQEPQWIP